VQIMLGCLYSRGSSWPLSGMNQTLAEDATVILMPGPAALRPTNAGKERETVILTVIAKLAFNVGRTIVRGTTLELHRPLQIAASKAVMGMVILGPAAQQTSPVSWAVGTVTKTVTARVD